MAGKTSDRLKSKREQIMAAWEKRTLAQVSSAGALSSLALRNSLPMYLDHLSEALAKNRKMDFKSVELHDAKAIRIGRLHGTDRAGSSNYGLTEVILEYHLMREVVFEMLEVEAPLNQTERDIVLDSIEQAVNDAAVRFSEVHADIQEKFVNTLTHDLKTPITSAKMNAQLILKRADTCKVSQKYAGSIVSSLDRLTTMIHDLLDVNRVRAGEELTLQFIHCDLDKIFREVTEEMTLVHGERFQVDSEASIQGLWACDGLRRTLENLLDNAAKYSTPDTPISIFLRKLSTAVELKVHNQGPPISEKDQSLLFEQYRRTKSAEVSAKPGWGIGLALVKGVVDAQKGSIHVTSTEGEGTSFIIQLPIANPTSSTDANAQTA